MMKQVLLPIFGIVMVLALAGAGTFASFSDIETSTGNYFETADGEDLILFGGVRDPINPDSVIHTWVMGGMFPGISEVESQLHLYDKSPGPTPADYAMIHISNVCSEQGAEESDTMPNSADGLDKYLQILTLRYDGSDLLYHTGIDDPATDNNDPATPWNEVDDVNGNGFVDLDDLEAHHIDHLTPVPQPNYASGQMLTMKVRLHESTTNDYQGDLCDVTMCISLMHDNNG